MQCGDSWQKNKKSTSERRVFFKQTVTTVWANLRIVRETSRLSFSNVVVRTIRRQWPVKREGDAYWDRWILGWKEFWRMEKEERISHCIIFSSHDHFYGELMYRKKDNFSYPSDRYEKLFVHVRGKVIIWEFQIKIITCLYCLISLT